MRLRPPTKYSAGQSDAMGAREIEERWGFWLIR